MSDETAELRFVALDDLAELPVWPAHRPIRKALLSDPNDVVVA